MLKRAFDVLVAIAMLIVFGPLFVLIALWVKSDSAGGAFFRQERMGRFGRPFRIFKFRSMVHNAPSKGPQVTSASDPRITKTGAFLRKYKLDELPQLFNVLAGDMSFVGPRPEVDRYVQCWSLEDRAIILSVRPGITDPASVKFRDEEGILAAVEDPERYYVETLIPQKVAIYREYVATRSLLGDVSIMLKTFGRVFGTS